MKKMLVFLLLLGPVLVMAQGDSPPGDNFFQQNYQLIIGAIIALIEILLRFKPTDKDWSILSNLYKVLCFLFPNRHKCNVTGFNGKFLISPKLNHDHKKKKRFFLFF